MKKNHSLLMYALSMLMLLMVAACSEKNVELEKQQEEPQKEKTPKELLEKYTAFVSRITDYNEVKIHESVTAYEICMKTKTTKPLRMCILDIDLKDESLSLETTYPADFTETNWPVRTIKKQAEMACESGKNVIAGFNADFFAMGKTGFPDGVVYHDGKAIKTENLVSKEEIVYFGIDNRREVLIGTYSDYLMLDKTKIQEMVCGKQQLVRNGEIRCTNGDPAHNPRTAVGTNMERNRVWVVVVDEYKPNQPRDGVTYLDMAYLMRVIGCYHAVNLDGGGSSTFLIKEDGTFRAWNKQPDATHRAVADGMLLIAE